MLETIIIIFGTFVLSYILFGLRKISIQEAIMQLPPQANKHSSVEDANLNDAVNHNVYDLAQRALKSGANPNIKDHVNKAWSLLDLAVDNNNPQIVKLLCEHGAQIRHDDPKYGHNSSLLNAVLCEYAECVEILLDHSNGLEDPEKEALTSSTNPHIQESYKAYIERTEPKRLTAEEFDNFEKMEWGEASNDASTDHTPALIQFNEQLDDRLTNSEATKTQASLSS